MLIGPSSSCALTAALAVFATAAGAGPPTGKARNICGEWLPLAQRVEQVCATDASLACVIDLDAFETGCVDPASLVKDDYWREGRLFSASCPMDRACAPAFVAGVVLRSTLTVALEQTDDDTDHRSIQVVGTLDVRARGKVKQFLLTPQVFADSDFAISNECVETFGGEGAQIFDWFPVPDQGCIFDQPIDFVGMLIPQPATMEQDLVSIARRAFPDRLAGLEVVPVLLDEDGNHLQIAPLENGKLEPNLANGVDGRTTRVARYPILIRFALSRQAIP